MELSKNAQKIMDLVKDMSAIELNDLVKSLEEEFGVSAVATVAVAGAGAGGEADAADAASNIELTAPGGQKIAVIKVVKEILGLGLKEAKEMVEKAPVIIKENCKEDELESIKTKLEEAGAEVSIK